MTRKINIGITVSIDKPGDSLFTNGIRQNVIILRDLFASCEGVGESYIINTARDVQLTAENAPSWADYLKHIITLQEARDKCDLVVVGQGSIGLDTYADFARVGIRFTKHIMGAELQVFNETVLFKEDSRNIYKRNGGVVEAVWMSDHYYDLDRHFFEVMYDCPVHIGPYVWDPRFIEHHMSVLQREDPTRPVIYKPSGESRKRVSVFEPNISLVKTCTVPVIIGEIFHRKYPDKLDKLSIFCGDKIKQKRDMIDFVKDLDINRAKRIFFEGRYPIVWTLLRHSDILLSHQQMNALNYIYLDAGWMGYPVLHNSPYMRDLDFGWYYRDNDAETAAAHLSDIIDHFDDVHEQYRHDCRTKAQRYMIDNPQNILGYTKLIHEAIG